MRKISIVLNASSPSGAKVSKKVISMVSCGSNYKITKSVHVSPALITTACTLLLCHCNHNELHIIWFTLKKSALSIVRTISASYKADFITMEIEGLLGFCCVKKGNSETINLFPQIYVISWQTSFQIKQVTFPQSVFLLGICAHYELGPDFYIFIWSKGNNSMTFFSKRKWNRRVLPYFSFSMGNVDEEFEFNESTPHSLSLFRVIPVSQKS